MKTDYYKKQVADCRHNTKLLWKVINNVIGKVKHSGSIISYITINGLKTYNPTKIANEFGKFYSMLGENHAKLIKASKTSIDDYIRQTP